MMKERDKKVDRNVAVGSNNSNSSNNNSSSKNNNKAKNAEGLQYVKREYSYEALKLLNELKVTINRVETMYMFLYMAVLGKK